MLEQVGLVGFEAIARSDGQDRLVLVQTMGREFGADDCLQRAWDILLAAACKPPIDPLLALQKPFKVLL